MLLLKIIQVEDSITLDDIREIIDVSNDTELGRYAIWSHRSSKLLIADFTTTIPTIHPSSPDSLSISLDPFSFEIITISAIEEGLATLGLLDKYNPLAGVLSNQWSGSLHRIEMKCLGRAGFYVDGKPPQMVKVGGKDAEYELREEGGGHFVIIDLDEECKGLAVIIDL